MSRQRAAGETLLIVEDDHAVRTALADLLICSGYRVLTAEDGRMALELLGSAIPGLIVTDLAMPVLSGWDLLRELRRRPDLASVPVLVYSAEANEGARGAIPEDVPVVAKTGSADDLLEVIRDMLDHAVAQSHRSVAAGGMPCRRAARLSVRAGLAP
jgi:CheY-like chemotaxis protein